MEISKREQIKIFYQRVNRNYSVYGFAELEKSAERYEGPLKEPLNLFMRHVGDRNEKAEERCFGLNESELEELVDKAMALEVA